MQTVLVRILHRAADASAAPLECLLADARERLAAWQAEAFVGAGALDVRVVAQHGGMPFHGGLANALRDAGRRKGDVGLVILGSGSLPLATAADLRRFVDAAARPHGPVLVNNRYSADVLAIPRATALPAIPELPGDNAMPRWLEERAGREIADLATTWRLQVDVDGPLDLLLLAAGRRMPPVLRGAVMPPAESPVLARLAAVRDVLADRLRECLVFGRVSTRALAAFERSTASRTRVFVEERGLRASSPLAQGGGPSTPPRRPRSAVGMLLDRDGPGALGAILAELGDAALVDTRVLLAHHLGPDESSWPSAEDRFASDLLLADRVRDPWLHALTVSALSAPIPILLGGHSLVGPGLRLVAQGDRSGRAARATGARGAPRAPQAGGPGGPAGAGDDRAR